jgi:hypothetical protein
MRLAEGYQISVDFLPFPASESILHRLLVPNLLYGSLRCAVRGSCGGGATFLLQVIGIAEGEFAQRSWAGGLWRRV